MKARRFSPARAWVLARFASIRCGLHPPKRDSTTLKRDAPTSRTYLAHEMANRTIVDVADIDVWPTDVTSTFDNATDFTKAVLAKGAMPIVLGGGHSITYPIVRGYTQSQRVRSCSR